jgi:quercetin dioxygenase-like cupin family protein
MTDSLKISALVLVTIFSASVLGAEEQHGRERLTAAEIEARIHSGPGLGSSGVSGIQTVVLKGDPSKQGVYTILLRVPAHTTIQAHRHPDDRVVTVISGTWNFGYGPRFDKRALKALPPGSFYTEPPNEPHFAQTEDSAVEVRISGYGPTGTVYENPADDPATKR